MGKRIQVQLFGRQNRSARIDSEATQGAKVGRDLYWPDGSVVQESEIRGTGTGGGDTTTGGVGGVSITLWSLIQGIPDIIESIVALTKTGWMRNDPNGTVTARDHLFSKNSIPTGETLTIPVGNQLLCYNEFTYDGGDVIIDGELVVLGGEARNRYYYSTNVSYELIQRDEMVEATGAGGITFTLPTAVGFAGQEIIIKNSTTGTLTIDANGTETIDGGLTATLEDQYESITLVSDGSNWSIV